MARSFGAAETIPLDDHTRVIAQVNQLTDGLGCERVIESVGKQGPLNLAGELTCERGRLIIAGYHQDGPRQVNMQLWNWRGLDVINAHERDPMLYVRGMRNAVEAVMNGGFDPAPLYTHTFALDQLSSAFDMIRTRPHGFFKALVLM
jgi:threonine dehydrogenase-like Zn-dependent dehydrogenase